MVETAGATGAAFNPTISTADLQDALREQMAREEAEAPARRVDNARRKVAKLQAQLAGAEEELAAAIADLNATAEGN